ncbi:MAG: hypothetical protein EOO22_20170 [Comamonadaceae bacterium]|nr:MAG: hypothetical protein EOO22_20170 [Comamonadaceae bacterium]
MRFVVNHDAAIGLWKWELHSAEGGSIARSAKGFATLAQLLGNLKAIRAQVPNALVFDLLGQLVEGG